MTLVFLVLPRAFALDTEPNDSCAAPEVMTALALGNGSLSTASDVDAFRINGVPPGTLRVVLLNRSNPDDDFLVELYNAPGTSLLASGTMTDGLASLSYTPTATAPYCVRVTGSAGGYLIISEVEGDLPAVTGVTNLGGTPISFSSPGANVKIAGSGFGTSTSAVTATFGGAQARILGVTDTELTVRIPTQAADGDIVVSTNAGVSTGYTFLVGVSTPPGAYLAEPDVSYYDDSLGVGLILNRTFVGFGYDVSSASATSTLNTVMGLDASRTGWTIVGESPAINGYVVEWTFSSTPTTTTLGDLLDDLAAQPGVREAEQESEVVVDALATPADFDLYYDSPTAGALAQINFEEARRLYWLSGAAAPSQVDLFVPDTGLQFGSATWGGSIDELPADRFTLYELTTSGWAETSASGHHTFLNHMSGYASDHGTTIAGVIGASNDNDPSWANGAARGGDNASGLWSSFELFGADDDADAFVDEPGEWGPGTVTLLNIFGMSTDDTTSMATSVGTMQGLIQIAGMPVENAGAVSMSTASPPDPFLRGYGAWLWRLRGVCRDRPIFAASGNEGLLVEDTNLIADLLPDICSGRSLVVGGVHAGGTDADTPYLGNYGDEVGLLAPMDGWFTATAEVDGTGAWTPTYEAVEGTSFGTPAVAAAYALLRGLIPESTLGDAAVLSVLTSSGDDISALYTNAGSKTRLNLFEAVWQALQITGAHPAMKLAPQVFVADYANDYVIAQDVDPETGVLVGSATTVDAAAEGCLGPTDVEVHPLGDVIYVLCADVDTVAAWTTNDWTYIGEVSLQGTVDTYSELAIGQDGVLRVGSIYSGSAVVESFDTWTGEKFMVPETLSTAATGRVYGAAVNPADGMTFAFGATDATATEDDDALVILTPDRFSRLGSTISSETFPSGTYADTMLLRDVSWYSDGSQVVGEFYGTSASGSDKELAFTGGGSTATATINNCEQPLGVVMDPITGSDLGWVACSGNYTVVEVDLSSTAGSYAPSTTMYLKASAIASYDHYPVFVEAAQNGAFLVVGGYSSSLTDYAYVISRADAAGGGSVYTGDYDVVGASLDRPRGAAITPMLSIATPRPGTRVGGIKRFHVIVRDPSITEIQLKVDGTTECTDTELSDGSAEDCLVNTSTWSSGDHEVTVVASGALNGDFSIGATYSTY